MITVSLTQFSSNKTRYLYVIYLPSCTILIVCINVLLVPRYSFYSLLFLTSRKCCKVVKIAIIKTNCSLSFITFNILGL